MIGIMLLIGNLTMPTNVTSLGGLFGWANVTANNLFGLGLTLALFVIVLLGGMLKGIKITATFASASFLCLLASLIMMLMNPPLVSALLPALFAGLSIFSALLLLMEGGTSVY
ncbi:MAG: hypothetical protein QXS03_01400 [Candidatus Micrarchaeaceae archaeon]